MADKTIYPYSDPEMGEFLMKRDGYEYLDVQYQLWMGQRGHYADTHDLEHSFFCTLEDAENDKSYASLPHGAIGKAITYFRLRDPLSKFKDRDYLNTCLTLEFAAMMFLELLTVFDEKDHAKCVYGPYLDIVFTLRDMCCHSQRDIGKKYELSELATYYKLYWEKAEEIMGKGYSVEEAIYNETNNNHSYIRNRSCEFSLDFPEFIEEYTQRELDNIRKNFEEAWGETELEKEEAEKEVVQHLSDTSTLELQREMQTTIGTMQRMCARL